MGECRLFVTLRNLLWSLGDPKYQSQFTGLLSTGGDTSKDVDRKRGRGRDFVMSQTHLKDNYRLPIGTLDLV